MRRATPTVLALLLLAACTSSTSAVAPSSSVSPPTTDAASASVSSAPTTLAPTTLAPTTLAPTTLAPTTLAPTTEAPTTELPATTIGATAPAGRPADFLGEETIGSSFEGRPITAWHRGAAGGKVVLVVGVIHGNENDGLKIVDRLSVAALPPDIDLWLLPMMNPDGVAHDVRGNGNGVDLNRNFPHDWTAISHKGNWQWSGPGPGSEPETQAYMAFTERIRPALTLWYHQDLFRVSPSKGRDAALRQTYARLSGLPYETVDGPTSIYTGVAATWTRTTLPEAMSFIVELGPTLSVPDAAVHASAVLAVAQMA
jgi:protein MpaA